MLTKQEIQQLDIKGLREEIASSRNDLMKMQFSIKNGTSKESHMIGRLRRYVARLKTVQRELIKDTPIKEEEKKIEEVKVRKTTTSAKKGK